MNKLTGNGKPSTYTHGEVGQFYEDTSTGDIYECRRSSKYSPTHGAPVGGYWWELRAKGEDIKEHEDIYPVLRELSEEIEELKGGGSGSAATEEGSVFVPAQSTYLAGAQVGNEVFDKNVAIGMFPRTEDGYPASDNKYALIENEPYVLTVGDKTFDVVATRNNTGLPVGLYIETDDSYIAVEDNKLGVARMRLEGEVMPSISAGELFPDEIRISGKFEIVSPITINDIVIEAYGEVVQLVTINGGNI